MNPLSKSIKRSRKAQASVEAFLIIGALLVLFSTIMFITIDKEIFIHESEEKLDKIALCYKMANLITSVYTAGENTEMQFSIPDIRENVTVFGGGLIYVGEIGKVNSHSCEFPRGIANNSVIQFPGTIEVMNENNTVFIKNV